jgi:hypothetical protein
MMLSRILLCAWLSVTMACASDNEPASNPDPVRAFQNDELPSGTVIYVRQKELTQSQLVLEVAARNVSDAYGLAWRLGYDPGVLSATQLEPIGAFGPGEIHAFSQPRAGLSLGAVSKKGTQAGIAAPDTTLATLTFDVLSPGKSRVDFVVERSAIVRADGSRTPAVQWIGGELAAD